MKIFSRILIIVIAFAVMMGITYSAVGVSGSSSNTPAFQRGSAGFTPDGGSPREFRDHDHGGGGVGMIFGLLKNTVIIAIIVAMVVFSKNFLQQQRQAVPVRIK